MKTHKKTLVVGASEKPERYSNMAIQMLLEYGHPVVAIGNKKGQVAGIFFDKERPQFPDIDTVTLYLGQKHQESYFDYILSLHPKRLIFNPGAENEVFEKLAQENGIKVMRACTLVLLRTGQY